MKVDFYSLIEEAEDKSEHLSENLMYFFDNLLSKGKLPASTARKIAQIRSKVLTSNLEDI